MILVIVESHAKAKKIGSFLGSGYRVMASFGHVRDLPSKQDPAPERYRNEPWARLGVDVDHDFRPVYVVPGSKARTVSELQAAAERAERVILATDDDREGESIAWHLAQLLNLKQPQRMVFHEITEAAIQKALASPRPLNMPLVGAQESRRILDRLVGFGVSPLLWSSVGARLSAGRVQSATLGALALQEEKRMAFVAAPYWRVTAVLRAPDAQGAPQDFQAQVLRFRDVPLSTPRSFGPDGTVTDGSRLLTPEEAEKLTAYLRGRDATVSGVTTEPYKSSPPPPFTTSSLQQAASVRLKLDPKTCMSLAQSLYEGGYITYLRTDSPALSDEATRAARALASSSYGSKTIPDVPRSYAAKSAGAQEAHEAIRPAGNAFRSPAELPVSPAEKTLYELIYTRTIASQMIDLRGNQTKALLSVGPLLLGSVGKVITEPGYTRAYHEDPETSTEQTLPPLAEQQAVPVVSAKAESKNTPAPKRFTEAGVIKEMERLGIGRPATYASTISTLTDRGYIRVLKRQVHVTLRGMLVWKYLRAHLPGLVDAAFTAQMEGELDLIAAGQLRRVAYLQDAWSAKIEPLIRSSTRATPRLDLPSSPGVHVSVARADDLRLHAANTPGVTVSGDLLPEQLTPENVKAALNGKALTPAASDAPGTADRAASRTADRADPAGKPKRAAKPSQKKESADRTAKRAAPGTPRRARKSA